MSRNNWVLEISSHFREQEEKEQEQAKKEGLFRKLWAEHDDIIQSQDYKKYCQSLLLLSKPTEAPEQPVSPPKERVQAGMTRKKRQAELLTSGKTHQTTPERKVPETLNQFSMSEEGQMAVQVKIEEQVQFKMHTFHF